MNFVHLHNHNEYSQLDGVGTAEKYVAEAKRLGFKYLGLCNHGNVDGCIKFQKACEKEGITPIIGCELYIVEDITQPGKGIRNKHICCFVRDKTGWQNLLKMLTIANLDGFYYRPRIDPSVLLSHCKGLVFTTACASSFINTGWGRKLLGELINKVGKNRVFLEIMPHQLKEQIKMNKVAIHLAKKFGVSLVASNDCHYPTKEGSLSQEVLLAIQRKVKWSDPKRWKFDIDDLYLKTKEELERAFEEQGIVPKEDVSRALKASLLIAKSCSKFRIEELPVKLPRITEEGVDEKKFLGELADEGLQKRIISPKKNAVEISKYKDRLKEELDLICDLGFERYFLIVWDLIKWCRSNNIMTGPGRGSVGGSLLAFTLFITGADPLKHKLLFSRFISPARIDLPDIDMDFEDSKRDDIRKYLMGKYGKDNVSGVSTFLTLKGKAAIRDVSRVFEVPIFDVGAAAKCIVVRSGGDFRSDFTIEDAFDTFEDGKKFKKKYPKVTKIANDLEGQVRGSGQHAAAICISKDNLKEGVRCNLCKRTGGRIVANWDKYDTEHVGLMKLDILGLSALTILSQTKEMVKENHGVEIDFENLPLEDPKVYEAISKGHTVGAFQIGSMGLSSYCKELGVENFEMLVNATSLWRPGTLRSGLVTEFADRKKGKAYKTPHPLVRELTKDTFGIIVYQEQVMNFMYDLAGLPWKTCDTIRKVISKSQGEELFLKFRDKFVDGCVEKKTLERKVATKVWDNLAGFGSYGFNKSHAVEYSMITFWDMWCKTYYPAEFMACSLTFGNADKKEEYAKEAKRLGLKISLPTIGKSLPKKWTTDKEKLYAPFMELMGVGEKTAMVAAGYNPEQFAEDKSKQGVMRSKKKSPSKTIISLLEKIEEHNTSEEKDPAKEKELQKFFKFNISDNPLAGIEGIYKRLQNKIVLLEGVNFVLPSKEYQLFLGKLPEVKFGYRKAVLKASKGANDKTATKHHMLGTAEDLGGVYGFLEDLSQGTYAMVVFNSDAYARKKNFIEHCDEKWLLLEANHPRKTTNNLFCNRVAGEEELCNCSFDGIKVGLIKKWNVDGLLERHGLNNCNACTLGGEATAPVPPSKGKKNVLILGEAPGRDEDTKGIGFVGKAGNQILWPELEKSKLSRELFHVTNVVKCFPKEAKTPSKKQIDICSEKWLSREISRVKPVLILALGNTALRFIKNESSGILGLNGTTEWDEKLGAWICWCIHPASVLYQQENKELFEIGIKNFARCIKNLT